MRRLSPAQRALSSLIAGFAALKVAEAAIPLDSFPLTRVGVFAEYRGRDILPWKVRLFARRGSDSIELRETDFGLTSNEYYAELVLGIDDLARRCGRLGRAYNARRTPAARIDALEAHAVQLARPGVGRAPAEFRLSCPLVEEGER